MENDTIHDYEDRHVVITGGTGGLGKTVVAALLDAGAICYIPCRKGAGASDLPASERLHLFPGIDLTDEAAVGAFYARLPGLWASIHLAGGFSPSALLETRLSDFKAQFDVNVTTCFLCCREAIRTMRKKVGSGMPWYGRIVNVSALPALVPTGGMLAYAVSKGAVATLTTSLAAEVLNDGILVNAIVPSIIDTPANRQAMPNADHTSWPSPGQVAETILFLASPQNHLTSGAIVPVYGRV